MLVQEARGGGDFVVMEQGMNPAPMLKDDRFILGWGGRGGMGVPLSFARHLTCRK